MPWSTLFTRFCLMFLKINVAITYAFMGEICYLEKVKLSTYIKDRKSRLSEGQGLVVFTLCGIRNYNHYSRP